MDNWKIDDKMSRIVTEACLLGFPTKSDTNQVVQPLKMARGLKTRVYRTINVAKTKAPMSCTATTKTGFLM